jgi:hypothetical protein
MTNSTLTRDIKQTVPFLPAFGDYVSAQQDAIGREWMGIVRARPDMPDALSISQEALQDHVPELIEDLVRSPPPASNGGR